MQAQRVPQLGKLAEGLLRAGALPLLPAVHAQRGHLTTPPCQLCTHALVPPQPAVAGDGCGEAGAGPAAV